MKVFISWSGEVSHTVALALKGWLPSVIQALEPFVSTEDIAKGGRWLARINAELEGAQFGVICLTPQNLESRWVLFEAGAIAVRFPEGRVAPLLIGIERAQVLPPLSQFQFTEPTRGEILKLVTDINACLGDKRLSADRLQKAFDVNWAELQAALIEQTRKAAMPPAVGLKPPPKRESDSMLAEILDLVRSIQRRVESDEAGEKTATRLAAAVRSYVNRQPEPGFAGSPSSAAGLARIAAARGIRRGIVDPDDDDGPP